MFLDRSRPEVAGAAVLAEVLVFLDLVVCLLAMGPPGRVWLRHRLPAAARKDKAAG